mmetsp:Transcript_40503/g.116428  ORF Transcript_40503/g.116428 Transcript_40503/m.116428 type:complete len:149 (-) Transcript_40503:121-567(-)
MDRLPQRTGMCCYCIPCMCCGPPVVYEEKPTCLCFDFEPCCGTLVKAAPTTCFGCKTCLVFGEPCFTRCSYPLFWSVKNADDFLLKWRSAVVAYAQMFELENEIEFTEMAIMGSVQDSVFVEAGATKAKSPATKIQGGTARTSSGLTE